MHWYTRWSSAVSPLNLQFSIKHVHFAILTSFIGDGHDPDRAAVGICRKVRDPQKRLHTENHNKTLAANSPLMPNVEGAPSSTSAWPAPITTWLCGWWNNAGFRKRAIWRRRK